MRKILGIVLFLASFQAIAQRNGLIDADTTTRPKAGLHALAFSTGQLKIVRSSGNSYGVITSNNAYVNPSWLTLSIAKITGLQDSLSKKVNAIAGKSLSANDYTTTEKNKLAGIATGAEVNVNADWTAVSGDAQILNKPTLGTAAALDVAPSGNASSTQVVKGNDTRLSDSRTPTSHTHPQSEVTGLAAALGAKSDTSHTHTTSKINDWTAAWAARFAAQSTSNLPEGSNLYFTNARVATYGDANYGRLGSANSWIGSNTFTAKLSAITGNEAGLFRTIGNSTDALHVQSSHAGGYSTVGFLNQAGTQVGSFGHENTSGKVFFYSANRDMYFYTSVGGSNTPILTLKSDNGNILVGTTVNAGYKLDVNGTARVSDVLSLATGSTKGLLYSGTKIVEAVNGGSFTQILVQPSSGNKDGVLQVAPAGTFTGSALELYNSSSFGTARNTIKNTNGIFQVLRNDVTQMQIFPSGNVHFQNGGTYTDIPSATVTINSTNQGFLPPRMTTANINAIMSPATGLIAYNTDLNTLCFYNGASWQKVTSTSMN